MLMVLAAVFLVASVGCAGAWNWYALLFFRWLGGVAVRPSREPLWRGFVDSL